MIELGVRYYCHKRPAFEPVVERFYDSGRGPCIQNVSCEHKDRCDMIYRHIKFESNKKGETDA